MKPRLKSTRLLIGLFVLAGLIGSACGPAADNVQTALGSYLTNLPEGFYGIKPVDALQALQADPKPLLVDVRDPKEIAENGFIEGAVNIPVRTLTQNLDKLPAKDQPIIVYCGAGHRGGMALTALRLLGYTNVKSIFGGLNGWQAAGLAVVTGTPASPVAGAAPQVDRALLAVLDKYLTGLPNGFYGSPPATVAKTLTAESAPFVIDVRAPKELADTGYIAGAVNIPLPTLFQNLDKLPQDKDTPIVTYCAIGHRGAIAMMTLQLLGYTNVVSLGGGFNGWVKAGLPVAMQ